MMDTFSLTEQQINQSQYRHKQAIVLRCTSTWQHFTHNIFLYPTTVHENSIYKDEKVWDQTENLEHKVKLYN